MRRAVMAAVLVFAAAAAFGGEKPASKRTRLDAPGRDWALVVDLKGFAVERPERRPDGLAAAIGAENKATGVVLTIFIEPAEGTGDSKAARDAYAKRLSADPLKMPGATTSERGEWAIFEYTLGSGGFSQRHVNAYMARDGMWIDAHFSKMNFTPADETGIFGIIDGITFEASKPDVKKYLGAGSIAYLKRDYAAAIASYAKALEMEKKTPTLAKDQWRVLVDNLGMAYGIGGDLANAKSTFEYGISKDGEYPNFHYNLACTYAEMGKLDEAIASLKTAFKSKANAIKGERMPDPRKDSSFKKFLDDPKFQAALKEIEGGQPQ